MKPLQVGIGTIECITVAIPSKINSSRAIMLAQYPLGLSTDGAVFVDVVAKKDNEIWIFGCHVPVRREISDLPV